MKKITLVMLSFLIVVVAMAQNVGDGVKQLYYQKYNTAKQTLQNAVNSDPKNADAIYWLGQALIAMEDVPAAKALYQKALNEGVNNPLIWVGMGHVETLDGKRNEARQHFEAAITASLDRKKNPNANVLAAIGRANADGGSNIGDPQYAIEKLKKASELNATDPDIFVNMGINYQKLGGDRGGEAVTAYNNALQRDPKYAKALYRIGRIYESQQNKELFENFYAKAIAADPQYTATYLALYDYYKNRDVNKALGYLQEYIKHAEQNPENEFFMADYLFRAGKYQESLAQGKQLENKYGLAKLPRLNVLYAYNYDRLGDSVQAKNSIERFLTSAKAEHIQSDHYVLAGSIFAKFPGSEDAASSYLEKAIMADTIKANQIDYMTTAAQIFEKAQKYDQQYNWLVRLIKLKGSELGEFDHYKLNDVSLKAMAYKRMYDSLAPAYVAAFPDKPQGYAFWVRAAKLIDTTGAQGLALVPIEKQNEFLMKDAEANKKAIYLNHYYLLVYYNDHAKDVAKAIEMTDKMMALYPEGTEEHKFAKTTKEALEKNKNRKPSTPKTTGNATTTTKASGTGK